MQRSYWFAVTAFLVWGIVFTSLPLPLRGLWLLVLMIGGPAAFFASGVGR